MQIRKERLTAEEFLGMTFWGAIFLIGFVFLCLAVYLCLGSMPFEVVIITMIVLMAKQIIKKARGIPSPVKTNLGMRNLSKEISHHHMFPWN